MIVQGVDLSLTGTGLARIISTDGSGPFVETATVGSKPGGRSVEARARRQLMLLRGIDRFLAPGGLLAIEAPAYTRTAGSRHERSGLWWAVVQLAMRQGCRVVEVSPTARARYATGRGMAAKDAVLAAVSERYSTYGVSLATDNEADALTLAALAARLIGRPIEPHPESWFDDVAASVSGEL